MNAYVNTYEMRMPAHYVDMNKKEMEYSGGWNPLGFLIGIAISCVADYLWDQGYKEVAVALDVASCVISFGGTMYKLARLEEKITMDMIEGIADTTVHAAGNATKVAYTRGR